MTECPYCGGAVADEDRYCPRCGERQTDREATEGFLDPAVVTYLDGVRSGARPFDPESRYHERLQADLGAAVGDFAHLAGVDLDLRDVLDVEDATLSADGVDYGGDLDAGEQQLLGVAVLLGLVSDAFPETGVDELLAYALELRDEGGA